MRGRSYFSFPFLLLMTLNEFFIEVSLFFKAKLMIFSFAFFWGGYISWVSLDIWQGHFHIWVCCHFVIPFLYRLVTRTDKISI